MNRLPLLLLILLTACAKPPAPVDGRKKLWDQLDFRLGHIAVLNADTDAILDCASETLDIDRRNRPSCLAVCAADKALVDFEQGNSSFMAEEHQEFHIMHDWCSPRIPKRRNP